MARQAETAGARWWAGYLGGPGAYRQWTPAEWAVLQEAPLVPACLWVPTYGLAEDPVQAAHDAVGQAGTVGLFGAIMLDTEAEMAASPHLVSFVDQFTATATAVGRPCPVYTGAGYAPPGSPVFAPLWGSTQHPAPRQAVQYGPGVRFGMSVDVDLCDPAFPLASWDPPPPRPPSPHRNKETEMIIIERSTDKAQAVFDGTSACWIPDGPTALALQATLGAPVTVSAEFCAGIPNRSSLP